MSNPLVSIIIRAKNESASLPALLGKIQEQTVKDVEVIIVDDHSTDNTLAVAKDFGCKVYALKTPFSYGGSLNYGIEKASGEFIISIAAHALPLHSNWIESYLNEFTDPSIAGLYGKQIPGDDANALEKFERFFNGVIDHNIYQPFFLNTNGCFRRSVWQQVHFNEKVWGLEDQIWGRHVTKLGYRFKYCPEAVVYHHHDKDTKASIKRYYKEISIYLGILAGKYS